jgi:beta-barrel assembly-enhancing protease
MPSAQIRTPLRARTATVVALCLGLLLPTGQAQVRLPALGDNASDVLPVGAERRLGEQIMLEIRRDPDLLDDPPLLAYLQGLWQPLIEAARKRGDVSPELDAAFTWELFLVRDRGVNAFALPGGFSGVYLGLVAITQTADEVAAVLAHELSHVTQRHVARGMANANQQNLLRTAGALLAILAATRSSNVDGANALLTGSQAAAAQGQLNFSRDMEREADRVGHAVLQDAGFAVSGMASMFERLELAHRLNDNGAFPYLRSHPITTERISDARERMVLNHAQPAQPTLLHQMMRARARVLMEANVTNWRRQQGVASAMDSSRTATERVAASYGAALASMQLREWPAATAALKQARTEWQATRLEAPRVEPLLQLLEAQLALEQGAAASALAQLDATQPGPFARAWLLLRAQATLAQSRTAPAGPNYASLQASMETLQTWVTERPLDASAWTALSQACAALGLPLRALRAEAEAAAAQGDLTGAIERMRRGQAMARTPAGTDHIEASVLDSRLRQLQAQRRALQPEQRGNGRGPQGEGEPEPR